MSLLFYGSLIAPPVAKGGKVPIIVAAEGAKKATMPTVASQVSSSALYWGTATHQTTSPPSPPSSIPTVREFRLLMCSVLSDLATHGFVRGETKRQRPLEIFCLPLPELPGYNDVASNPSSLGLLAARVHSGFYDAATSPHSSSSSASLQAQWSQFQIDCLDVFTNAVFYHSAFDTGGGLDLVKAGLTGIKVALRLFDAASSSSSSDSSSSSSSNHHHRGLSLINMYKHFNTGKQQQQQPQQKPVNHPLRLALMTFLKKFKTEAGDLCQQYDSCYQTAAQHHAKAGHTKSGGSSAANGAIAGTSLAFATVFFDSFSSLLPRSIAHLEHQVLTSTSNIGSLLQMQVMIEWMLNLVLVCGGCTTRQAANSVPSPLVDSAEIRRQCLALRNTKLCAMVLEALKDTCSQLNTPLVGGSTATERNKRNRDGEKEDTTSELVDFFLVADDDFNTSLTADFSRMDPWGQQQHITSNSTITVEEKEKLLSVIAELEALDTAYHLFSTPVLDPKDYARAVEKPMDFFTMTYKLQVLTVVVVPTPTSSSSASKQSGRSLVGLGYPTVASVLADVDLLYDNCLGYNGPDSAFTQEVAMIRGKLSECCEKVGLAMPEAL